jgi:Flp pilus assembly protein TadD
VKALRTYSQWFRLVGVLAVTTAAGLQAFAAQDLKITIPRHTELTPVQRLNRDGVEAIRKNDYEKAEALFYKAYLYDPTDPFTLNNLGYVAELNGELTRAQQFYKLASEQGTDAFVSLSNEKNLQGHRMSYALDTVKDIPMRVNRMNFDAMTLMSQNRYWEAETLLQQARRLDPQNIYTLNNLGVASESIGDYQDALSYYYAAANARSKEPVVVTVATAWRGKPVSEMAENNYKRLQARMKTLNSNEAQASLLAARGVNALNQNDWETARKDFLEAYKLNPYSAFSLNNAGYVAERDGDVETAQFFYQRARSADDASAKVGLATQQLAQGNPLGTVANWNNQETEDKIQEQHQIRVQQKGPIELLNRNGTPVVTSKPQTPAPAADQAPPVSPDTTPQIPQ